MKRADQSRCRSILATLLGAGGTETARIIRDELELVHGIPCTLDRVRADLQTMADLSLLTLTEDTACITVEGRETAQGLRKLPG